MEERRKEIKKNILKNTLHITVWVGYMKERRNIKKILRFKCNLGMDEINAPVNNDEDSVFRMLCTILEGNYYATEEDVIQNAAYEYMEEKNLTED